MVHLDHLAHDLHQDLEGLGLVPERKTAQHKQHMTYSVLLAVASNLTPELPHFLEMHCFSAAQQHTWKSNTVEQHRSTITISSSVMSTLGPSTHSPSPTQKNTLVRTPYNNFEFKRTDSCGFWTSWWHVGDPVLLAAKVLSEFFRCPTLVASDFQSLHCNVCSDRVIHLNTTP